MGVCATPGFGLPAECAVEGLELLEAEAAVPVQIVFVKRLLRALRETPVEHPHEESGVGLWLELRSGLGLGTHE